MAIKKSLGFSHIISAGYGYFRYVVISDSYRAPFACKLPRERILKREKIFA